MIEKRPEIVEESARYQYLATISVDLLVLGYGAICGWTSPSLLLLTSDDSPLPSGKITMEEASWVASMLAIGCLGGAPVSGFFTNKFGRKWPLIMLSLPMIVSWLLILFAQNVFHLYIARLMHGFILASIFVIIPTFLTEIANDRVRGFLASTIVLIGNVGLVLAFTFGSFCSISVTPIFVIVLTILFAISFVFFPESPAFLMKQNKIAEAESSIRFYQNIHGKIDECNHLQSEMDKLLSSIQTKECDKHSWKWSDLRTGIGRKAITIGIVLVTLNQCCGCFAMLNYTANIMKEAGSSMSPNTSAIVIGVIQLFGSYVATYLVERAGRKFLYITSTIGTAFGLITLGGYMMLKSWHYNIDAFNWIPVASFSFTLFIASWAILTLPFLVIPEVMPENLKDFGVTFSITILNIFQFVVVKYFPMLNELIGFHGSMFFFACVCLSSTVFIVLFLPETKGKSYEQIMNSLQ